MSLNLQPSAKYYTYGVKCRESESVRQTAIYESEKETQTVEYFTWRKVSNG